MAAELASTHGAVKTRLHKARATLRVRLSDLREEPEMVPMRIADVRAGDRHVVVLEERDGSRRLPIWMGEVEATALALRLHAVEFPRPGTYDLTGELLRAAGTDVEEVRIVRLTDMTFYAEVVLAGGATVDARPSDALNLALVAGAPILVDERVIAGSAGTRPSSRATSTRRATLACWRTRVARRSRRTAAGSTSCALRGRQGERKRGGRREVDRGLDGLPGPHVVDVAAAVAGERAVAVAPVGRALRPSSKKSPSPPANSARSFGPLTTAPRSTACLAAPRFATTCCGQRGKRLPTPIISDAPQAFAPSAQSRCAVPNAS